PRSRGCLSRSADLDAGVSSPASRTAVHKKKQVRACGRIVMLDRTLLAALVSATALMWAAGSSASAADAKYPSWKGQWTPAHAPLVASRSVPFDSTRPEGPAQQA